MGQGVRERKMIIRFLLGGRQEEQIAQGALFASLFTMASSRVLYERGKPYFVGRLSL
jgi:hypothetical protein